MDSGTSHYESIIRIRTNDGTLKYVEINLYSKFDEKGDLISRYGLMKDVTTYSHDKIRRPVDFLLSGFKNSKKLALLIEPLNTKQYEFSQGFYHLIEEINSFRSFCQSDNSFFPRLSVACVSAVSSFLASNVNCVNVFNCYVEQFFNCFFYYSNSIFYFLFTIRVKNTVYYEKNSFVGRPTYAKLGSKFPMLTSSLSFYYIPRSGEK